ncbi:unnamed protein product [marine sediment metagenome]|uniref:Uncharacterized protein n=1 Tax=marine sediment metagenome TaxID=412755 RepID=X1BRG7_9ZZZZ
MSKWWWEYQHSATQGPLLPAEEYHPDPSTTILLYITRRAWRVVVLQTIRLSDGYSWRTANIIAQGHGEHVFVGDAQSRVVRNLHSYPFSESASAVDRIATTTYPLTRVYLDEGVDVLDDYSWIFSDLISRTMPEAVDTADGYSRTLSDLVTKTLPEAVGVADDYTATEVNVETKTMPEAVG